MNSPLSSIYLRFLHLSNALTEDSDLNLTPNQRALLESLALAWHQGKPLSVRQSILLEKLGSPATLHKRLTMLRAQGYIEEKAVEGDKRTKLLIPTKKALIYFESLARVMTRS